MRIVLRCQGWLEATASVQATTQSLMDLQRRLTYFLDNQSANGLVLDRQANQGHARPHGLCSLARPAWAVAPGPGVGNAYGC